MRHTIHRPSLRTVARARWTGVAALAALLLIIAAGAPAARAMPPGGYEPLPETTEPEAPSEPVQAPKPKPSVPSAYCITACTNAFVTSVSSTTSSKVGLAWPGASGYTGYDIERRKTNLGGTFAVVARLGPDASDYTDTGLTDNTSYDYRVTATGASATASSNVTAARTLPAPTTLSAGNATTRSADLHWNGTTGATGYAVERRQSAAGGSFATVANLDATARGYTDGSLAHSTGYDYRVSATGVTGLGPSNQVAVPTLPPQVQRVKLSGFTTDGFGFRALSPSGPAYAEILNVRNVAVDENTPGNGLALFNIAHGVTVVAAMPYNTTTSAFNGQSLTAPWALRVGGVSATVLWDCALGFVMPDCSSLASVTLEVTWF